jgi:alpha-L-fucosidase
MKNRLIFLAWTYLLLSGCSSDEKKSPPAPYGPIPSEAQLAWHEMEMYCLIHFGVDTYTDKEWGYGDEDPKIFNPREFDAGQIVRAAKAGGFKGIIVVAKHHDGLCLWPTKTTEHNISKTAYKDGKGDIIREFKEACDKEGMKLGLYCSPWDRNSPYYGKPEYVNIYREQLKELYSNYGPLFISWHDGANGGDGYYGGAREERKIDRSTYYGWDSTWAITRKMQPGAVIFGDVGPDVRWVGNEEGHAGETSWATYTPQAPDSLQKPANGYVKYWLGIEGTRDGKYWMPAECDVPLRPGWFYHASQDTQVKSVGELVDLYYKSVGSGADLDLGIAPDRRGLLHENDVQTLMDFGTEIKKTFATNLASGAKLTASNIRYNDEAKYGPSFLFDNDRYSYWATDDSVKKAELVLDLTEIREFDVIRLRENIKLGQRIDSFALDALEEGQWQIMATGTSIGANRLLRLSRVVQTNKIRLRIIMAKACVALSGFGLYRDAIPGASKSFRYDLDRLGNYMTHQDSWKVLSSIADSRFAIDKDEKTIVSTNDEIIIDMGDTLEIKRFRYLPRQDGKAEGVVDKYSYSISMDGKNWEQVAAGEFGNIRNNPVRQETILPQIVKARYFKLSAVHVLEGKGMTVAELSMNYQ